jgi:stress response protein YsnF
MSKTVIGLFDRRTDAEAAYRELLALRIPKGDLNVVAHQHAIEDEGPAGKTPKMTGTGAAAGAGTGAAAGVGVGVLAGIGALMIPGIGPAVVAGPIAAGLAGAGVGAAAGGLLGALVGMGIPDEEAKVYSEGVRRGGTLLTCKCEDEFADLCADTMEKHHATDTEERRGLWRREGWTGYDAKAEPWERERLRAERDKYVEKIPVVEEQIAVGKREVERGGVRVFSHVVHRPVAEQVSLREESVGVSRQRVDRPLGAGEAAFQEKEIEVRAKGEVPVVAKQARVVEEVTVTKEARQRSETVRDDLKRTEIEVQPLGGERLSGPSFDTFEPDLRRSFANAPYARTGSYEQWMPAYRYGYDLARDRRYRGRDFATLETDARAGWERQYGAGTWDRVKMAVRHAWDKVRMREDRPSAQP